MDPFRTSSNDTLDPLLEISTRAMAPTYLYKPVRTFIPRLCAVSLFLIRFLLIVMVGNLMLFLPAS